MRTLVPLYEPRECSGDIVLYYYYCSKRHYCFIITSIIMLHYIANTSINIKYDCLNKIIPMTYFFIIKFVNRFALPIYDIRYKFKQQISYHKPN